jgi:predicted Fe-Mo cluster-binding NifX family protein
MKQKGTEMQIAITSQNRKTITEHAGQCRKFWVYEVDKGVVRSKKLVELPLEQSFHHSSGAHEHPLDGINILISGSMGLGLHQRLKQKGIQAVVTMESDPDRAVAELLCGCLEQLSPGCCDHDAHHGHHH